MDKIKNLVVLFAILSIGKCAVITYDNLDFVCSEFTSDEPVTKSQNKLSKNDSELNDLYLNFYHKVKSIHSKKTLFNNQEMIISKYNCKNKHTKHFFNEERSLDLITNKAKMEKLNFLYKVLNSPIVSKCSTKNNDLLEIKINIAERRPKGFILKFNLNIITNKNVIKEESFFEHIKFYGCASLVLNQPYYFKLNSNASLNCSELNDNNVDFIKRNSLTNDEIVISNSEKYQIVNNSLKITNLDETDLENTFECVSKKNRINPHPYIKKTNRNSVRRLTGLSVNLKCKINHPVIKSTFNTLKWYKLTSQSTNSLNENLKVELKNTTNLIISLSHDNFALYIRNLSSKDKGTYICTFQNEYGTFSREFYVNIYGYELIIFIFAVSIVEVVFLSVLFIFLCK